MQKRTLFGIVVVAVLAIIYFASRPEPTPSERISDAVEEVGQAVEETAEEIADAATDAADAVKAEVETKSAEVENQAASVADSIATQLSDLSQDAQDRLAALVPIWRDAGIVSEDGIDFEAAISAVEETDMGTDARMQLVALLEFLRDAPGEVKEKLSALESAL